MSNAAFSGFPKEAVGFLKKLKANNNREWFADNKKTYESAIKQPAVAFGDAMTAQLEVMTGIPHSSKLFRIHRDLRFSKDKRPYNTHIHMTFAPESDLSSPPCWFFALETDRLIYGAGTFGFDKQTLEDFRSRVQGPDGDALAKLVKKWQAGSIRLHEPELKRVPNGYPKDHPHADLLRHKGLSAWSDDPDTLKATKPAFTKTCGANYKKLKPLFDWLWQAD